jgi:LacI family transcriptional regulator
MMRAIQAYAWRAGWQLEAGVLPKVDPPPDMTRSEPARRIVAGALHFIRRKAIQRALSVREVVEQVSLSRTPLLTRFQARLGHSPREEIARVRIEQIQWVLEQTDWAVKQIAAEMGFRTVEELARFFRHQTGLSPTVYRNQLASDGRDGY